MRPIPDAAVSFVQAHEGCKLTAYADVGAVATVGYGHTAPGLVVGQTISQAQADAYLRSDLATAATRLAGVVSADVIADLTANQYAALLSFVFNVGCDPAWTVWKLLNARQYEQVPAQLQRFVNAGGNKVQGLVNRRAAEVVLWSTAEPGSVPDDPSSAVTRAMPTPPTPIVLKPVSKKFAFAGCSATILATCAPYVDQAKQAAKAINDNISPYAGNSVILQHLQASLSVGLAALGVATAGLYWLSREKAKTQ